MRFSERFMPLGLLASLLLPVVAQAEMPSVEAIAHFTGNLPEGGNGAAPEAPLMDGGDGFIYGFTTYGGGTGAIHNFGGNGGALFRFPLGAVADAGLARISDSGPSSLSRLSRGQDGTYYATYNSDGNSARALTRYKPGETAWTDFRHFETTWPDPDPVRRPTVVIEGSDGRLYGASPASGTTAATQHGNAVWVMKKDGTGLSVLHAFDSANTGNGSRPDFIMQGSDGRLYGVTRIGGSPASGLTGRGVLFSLKADGSDFTRLHDFDGSDGNLSSVPRGPLVEVGDWLYGITASGGDHNSGVLYRVRRAGGDFAVLHHFTLDAGNTGGRAPRAIILAKDGHLYGITPSGGMNKKGVIFRYHMTDGYQPLVTFDAVTGPAVRGSNTGTNAAGAEPYSLIQAGNGDFYGVAYSGGKHGWGTVFRFRPGDEVPVFRFWPRSNFYMGVPSHQPEWYPPYTVWSDGSLIVQNYDRLDMRWKLENVTDCVAGSDQPGSTWSGPVSALETKPSTTDNGSRYYIHPVVPTVGRYTYTLTCKAADNGEAVTESVTLQVESQDLPLKESKGGGGALGAGLLPLLGAALWLRRRRVA